MANSTERSIMHLNKTLLGIAGRLENPLPANEVAAQIMLRSVRENFRAGGRPRKWKPSGATKQGYKTLLVTGSLMRKITKRVTKASVKVGLRDKRANILNYGGTITPKRGKYLTIPASGMTANERRRGMTARDFDNTFVMTAKSGKKFIAQNMGKGKKPRILFSLVTKSVIPATPYMLFQKQDIKQISEVYQKWMLKGA